MRRSHYALTAALVLGSAGLIPSAAAAIGPGAGGHPIRATASAGPACPVPPGASRAELEIKDGKIYYDGKAVATLPSTEGPVLVVVIDGTVHVGDDAERIAKKLGLPTRPPTPGAEHRHPAPPKAPPGQVMIAFLDAHGPEAGQAGERHAGHASAGGPATLERTGGARRAGAGGISCHVGPEQGTAGGQDGPHRTTDGEVGGPGPRTHTAA